MMNNVHAAYQTLAHAGKGVLRAGFHPDKNVPVWATPTITDHTEELRFWARLIKPYYSDLNWERVDELLAFHDLPSEIIVGDITPKDGIPVATKHAWEREAARYVTSRLGSSGAYILSCYLEYDEGKTPEAKMAKQLDKLEYPFVAQTIAQLFPDLPLEEGIDGKVMTIWSTAEEKVSDPLLVRIRETFKSWKFTDVHPHLVALSLLAASGNISTAQYLQRSTEFQVLALQSPILSHPHIGTKDGLSPSWEKTYSLLHAYS